MGWYWDVAVDIGGMLLGVAYGLAMLSAACYWQYWEYRNQWSHSLRALLLLKGLVPVAFALMVLVSMNVAGGVSGMEALGGFYLGVFLALAAAPFATAALARSLGVAFKQALGVSGSMVAALLIGWFGVGTISSAGAELVRFDFASRSERARIAYAEEHAAPAGERILPVEQHMYRMPDGTRLAHVVFQIAPGLPGGLSRG